MTIDLETLNAQLQSWLELPGTVVEIHTPNQRFEVRRISGWAVVVKITGEKNYNDREYKPASQEFAGTQVAFFEEHKQGPYFCLSHEDERVFNTYSVKATRVNVSVNLS